MKKRIGVAMIAMAVFFGASAASAQMQHPASPPAGQTAPGPPPQHGMMMQPQMGMMCPMMGMMQGGGMQGGGMQGMGMMRGMPDMSDPKAAARVLKFRGDVLKAISEVMLKHAQALEQGK